MPLISAISGQLPSRIWVSAWFTPKAFTSMTTLTGLRFRIGALLDRQDLGSAIPLDHDRTHEMPPSLSDGG
jgi:hypothetical protein